MSSKAKKQKGLQPKLRFPEFRGAEGWQQSTIGELGSFYYGKSAPKWSLSPDAPTLCVRYGELYTKFGTIISEVTSRTNIDPATLKFSKGGEILIPRVGEKPEDFANCCYLPFSDIAIGEMISVYETKEYPIFYTYYFRTLRKQFARVVEGQNVKNLYYVNLEPIPVGKPIIPEQKKVADCLSSLDELIAAEDQKLEAFQQHKKGLMQELFPAEGETFPKRRFPEFKNAPEWEEKPLGTIAEVLPGFGFPEKYQGQVKGKYPFYKVSDISNSLQRGEYFIKRAANCIDEATLKILRAKPLPVGTTIFAKIGEAIRLNRRAITTVPCVIDNNVAGLKSIDGQSTDLFLYYTFLSINLADYSGGAVPSVNKSTIENISVIFPNAAEQKRIADFLSSIDDLITAQSQKIGALRNHKTGLMQQFFPSLVEVEA